MSHRKSTTSKCENTLKNNSDVKYFSRLSVVFALISVPIAWLLATATDAGGWSEHVLMLRVFGTLLVIFVAGLVLGLFSRLQSLKLWHAGVFLNLVGLVTLMAIGFSGYMASTGSSQDSIANIDGMDKASVADGFESAKSTDSTANTVDSTERVNAVAGAELVNAAASANIAGELAINENTDPAEQGINDSGSQDNRIQSIGNSVSDRFQSSNSKVVNVNDWGSGFQVQHECALPANIDRLTAFEIAIDYSGAGILSNTWMHGYNGPVNSGNVLSNGGFGVKSSDVHIPVMRGEDVLLFTTQVNGAVYEPIDFTLECRVRGSNSVQ